MKFLTYLNEALPLSKAKHFTKMYNRKLHDEAFKGKDRIYIKFENKERNTYVNDTIKYVLSKIGYEIIDYVVGTAKKIDKSDNRIFKIGRILTKEDLGNFNDSRKAMLDIFLHDENRKSAKLKDPYIVLSRHPYDIAGMSTDRGWSSCMALGGAEAGYLPTEIKGGTIVAYLINGNDRNINKPVARIAIKPFINKKTKKIKMITCNRIYGTATENFYKEVNRLVNKLFTDIPVGEYQIDDDKFYSGDYGTDSVPHFGDKEIEIKTIQDVFTKIKDMNLFFNYFPVGTRAKSYRDDGIYIADLDKFYGSITHKDIKKIFKEYKNTDFSDNIYVTKLLIFNAFRRGVANQGKELFSILAKISAQDSRYYGSFELNANVYPPISDDMIKQVGKIYIPEAIGSIHFLDKFFADNKLLAKIAKEIIASIRSGDRTLIGKI